MMPLLVQTARMQYRPLGRTGLRVSAVGFGTSQLRRVSKTQAIDTLLAGFELGVNIVHTAPDYEGAEDLVADAVARTPHKIIVACNGYDVHYNRTGRVRLFEKLFEATCRRLRTDRLDLFGIASIDDREAFGENVWGRHGMVEFLQRKKKQGRLGATFCTTHGKPEFNRKLIESGAFDAVMISYNDLGFHLLTLHPPAGRHFEDVRRNRSELFPLCREHGVGLMIMMPLGGGLLCRSKAFGEEWDGDDVAPQINAGEALRSILSNEEISCVLPGTACVEEARENAIAGHTSDALGAGVRYPSCVWLEHGLAFNRRSLNACLIAHHDRGYPYLCDFNGGEVDMTAVLAAKARIIAENQNGGHDRCRGCPHLVTRRWPAPRYPIRLMGIAQFAHCNIKCTYCYLQTKDPSEFIAGFDPYAVLPPIKALARDGMLDPHLTVDWGGGEPTIYPEFDDVLTFLTKRGALTWVHTNGTRLPRPIKQGLSTKRIHILCSIDAGTRATWMLIKKRDLLEIVWRNLEQYIRLGCRVMLKYIVKDENCAPGELRAFVRKAAAIGAKELVLDIDYDYPNPSPAVIDGLRLLKRLATERGIHTTFGSTGSLYTPEIDVAGRLRGDAAGGRFPRLRFWLQDRVAYAATQARLAARQLRYA